MASWNGNSFPCPMCKAEPTTVPTEGVECFYFNNYPVTLPDRSEISFEEATTKYLEDYFPNYNEESYKVPAAFSYDQDESLDFVTDDEVHEMAPKKVKQKQQRVKTKNRKWKGPSTPQKIIEDRRQKESVEKIASAFYSLGKEILAPMFVVSEFKFSNFARNSKLPKQLKKRSYRFEGDHDILIISLKKGVIFIQVKSVKNTDTRTCWQQLKCAFEQVQKDELAMKSMNADLSFVSSLSMRGFVGVPNLTDEQLSGFKICKDHRKIILTASNLPEEHFSKFLSNCFSEEVESKHLLDINEYKLLVSRYVGLASIVKLRTVSDAITNVGGKVARIILNPEQVKCLRNNARKNIIMGDYGTGKSLLLMKKAEEIAKMGGNVYIISFSSVFDSTVTINTKDIDNLVDCLKRMHTSTNTAKNEVIIHSFIEHLKYVGKCKSLSYPEKPIKRTLRVTPDIVCDVIEESVKQHGDVHYFLDEVPLTLTTHGGRWKRFERACESNKSMFMWIVISSCSAHPSKGNDFSAYDKCGDLPEPSFQKTYLTRCMRTTKEVFRVIQAVRDFKDDHFCDLVSHGNVLHGQPPWWLEISPCSCANVDTPLNCRCVGSRRLRIALTKILEKLEGILLNDITVLLHNPSPQMTSFLTVIMEDACKASSINYRLRVSGLEEHRYKKKEHESAITLGDLWSHKGNENKVVIYVDPYGGPVAWKVQPPYSQVWPDICLAASRSLAHFIIITWPLEETRAFEIELGKGFVGLARYPDPGLEIFSPYLLELASDLLHGRPDHFWKGKFMDYLLEKNLIEKININFESNENEVN